LLGERTFSTTALSRKGRQRNRHFRYGRGDGRMTHLRTVPQQSERPGRFRNDDRANDELGCSARPVSARAQSGSLTLDEMTTRKPALGSFVDGYS
jgi:hypothetical protein